MIEQTLELETADGRMPTFITRPEEGGPHPAVVFYMDAPGIREELRDFARRLGTAGYCCLLPSLYYRDGSPSFPHGEFRTPEQTREMRALMDALTNARVADDTRALLAHIDADGAARPGPVGCVGFCMSGAYVLTVCGTFPERFRAGVAMHGVRMITEAADSPHRLIPALQGEHYWGFAEHDAEVPLSEVDALSAEVKAHGAPVRIEVHPGTKHGFVFGERPIYVKAEAERYWERTCALFRRVLG